MSTELDVPLEETNIATIQDITKIHLLIEYGQLEYYIETRAADGEPIIDPAGNTYIPKGEIFATDNYQLKFSDAPSIVKDHLRAVLKDVRAHARNNGYLGEGTDSDPIE